MVADALSRPPPPAAPPADPDDSFPLTDNEWPDEAFDINHPAAAFQIPTCTVEEGLPTTAPAAQPVDYAVLARLHTTCPEVAAMRRSNRLQVVSQTIGDTQLLGDISTGTFRPLVPPQLRENIVTSLHSIHHPGVWATKRLVSARFCWPFLAKQAAALARSCIPCQRGKVHRPVHLQPAAIPVPHRRFAHIHMDLVGPLPLS